MGKKVTLASYAVQGCMNNTLYFEIKETQIKILKQQFFQKMHKYDYSYQEFAFEVDYKF